MATSLAVMSNYLEDKILKHMLAGDIPLNVYEMPTTVYLGVHSSEDGAGEGDTGTEITGGYYEFSRIASVLATDWEIVGDIVISNSGSFTFNTATNPWGTVYGWGIYDNIRGGNLLFCGLFDTPVYIDSSQALKIQTGKLSISFSGISGQNGGWTSFSANKMAEWVVNGTSFDLTLTGTNLALVYDIETDTNNNLTGYKEISGFGYNRIKLFPSSPWYFSPIQGKAWNNSEIIFSTAVEEDWGTITDIILFDNDTGLNPIFWGHLTSPITVNQGDGIKIIEEGLVVGFY